jgi:hypothetical protein
VRDDVEKNFCGMIKLFLNEGPRAPCPTPK